MRQVYRQQTPKRYLRILLAISLLVIAGQILFPARWAGPVVRIGERTLLFPDKESVNEALRAQSTRAIMIKTEDKTYEALPAEFGVGYNESETLKRVVDYPWWQRLLPFSVLWRSVRAAPLSLTVDESQLSMFSEQVAGDSALAPTNADLTAEGEKIVLNPGENGKSYDQAVIAERLQHTVARGQTSLQLGASAVEPKLTDKLARDLIKPAQQRANEGFTIQVGTASAKPSKAELASWLRASYDESAQSAQLSADADTINRYLQSQKDTLRFSQARGLDASGIAPQVVQALADGKDKLEVKLVTISGKLYAHSQSGLRVLLEDIVKEKGDYGIAVQEINGNGWQASADGDATFIAASTYKLFVAYSTLKRIEAGTFSWSDSTSGSTLSTCFDRMIVNSDNPCAEALGRRIGWQTVIKEMRELGLTHTSHSDTFYSRADDQVILLTKLARGEILTEASRNRLFDVMKRQVYRKGIPAGTGVEVADKVGFLYSLLHDAAIVYGPKSTYALVILTDGSTWGDIADAADRIHTFLQD